MNELYGISNELDKLLDSRMEVLNAINKLQSEMDFLHYQLQLVDEEIKVEKEILDSDSE